MPARASLLALGWLAFFMADVRDGLGPFLATYLQQARVQQELIGYTMTAGGLAAVAVTPFARAWVDRSHAKRAMTVIAALAVMAASATAFSTLSGAMLIASQVVTGVAGAVLAATMAALTLGLAKSAGFRRQMGRNEAASHTGNTPLMVQRFSEGNGRFSTSLGFVMTPRGIGAAMSPALANTLVGAGQHFALAFAALEASALLALPFFWLAQRQAGGPPADVGSQPTTRVALGLSLGGVSKV